MGIAVPGPHDAQHGPAISRLKVHLRLLRLAGQVYRVVTLRPGTAAAFSTNFFHQTWHVVSDQAGARLLARLLWGLSFQRRPGTLILVHGPHLRPTPFEAERSDPFVLLPSHLTPVNEGAFRELKGRLKRLGAPDQTIRWLTFGMDVATGAGREQTVSQSCPDDRPLWRRERMGRCGGLIYYSAPPPLLRQQALAIDALRVGQRGSFSDMDYYFLAAATNRAFWRPDGEVQIFADYRERVAAAVEARRELVPNPRQPILCESVQWDVSRRRDAIRRRKRACRRGRVPCPS